MTRLYTIHPAIKEKVPGLRLGIIRYHESKLSATPKLLQGRVNLFMENMRMDYLDKAVSDVPGVKEMRSVFKSLGMDPSRYRPSNEALIRRILQNKPFSWVNSGVDVNNFLSIQFGLPAGLYNADKIQGDIILRSGELGDVYDGLNGREITGEDKFFLADNKGIFGSPFVDSVRTRVDEATVELLHIFFIPPAYNRYPEEQILRGAAEMFTNINGGSSGIDGQPFLIIS
ncbi:phenylalanine--tRNA ligase beta subunit-related protein [Aneurinibacillus sp. Ricciae_BoGa-3]|uniref:B3/B4 domain-containing protein n=1 Tax=Aneurinibacillus sp. Ricciae_BoGa-3 TaxID=3022697 RepID=UPI00234138D6|nr:phenylalanine--tRNA ligase beta subunit-related protein [Aneurinibacillus sp. Ricciae_BoGa-3]WCK55369.1 phenylalanine--tRNA ligase beta subunit-related protein [Aneurinibacillus sp. Ricciae_BoGa-3]